jgi:hypothetical protein
VTTRLDLERYAVHLVMEEDRALGRREAVGERYERLRRELHGRFGVQP